MRTVGDFWDWTELNRSLRSHLVDTTARTAARLAAGQALAAIVPARLAQLVAGASPTMTISKLTMAASLVVVRRSGRVGSRVALARTRRQVQT